MWPVGIYADCASPKADVAMNGDPTGVLQERAMPATARSVEYLPDLQEQRVLAVLGHPDADIDRPHRRVDAEEQAARVNQLVEARVHSSRATCCPPRCSAPRKPACRPAAATARSGGGNRSGLPGRDSSPPASPWCHPTARGESHPACTHVRAARPRRPG